MSDVTTSVHVVNFQRTSSADKWESGIRVQSFTEGSADRIIDKEGKTVDEPWDIRDMHHQGCFRL